MNFQLGVLMPHPSLPILANTHAHAHPHAHANAHAHTHAHANPYTAQGSGQLL